MIIINTQEIKQYFQSIKRLNTMIDSKLEILSRLRMLSKSVPGVSETEKVKSAHKINKMCDIISRIVDLENEINSDIDKFVDAYREIDSVIKRVENNDYRTLLMLRYLNFNTWEEIAEKMNYSVQWVHKLHGRAVLVVNSLL